MTSSCMKFGHINNYVIIILWRGKPYKCRKLSVLPDFFWFANGTNIV